MCEFFSLNEITPCSSFVNRKKLELTVGDQMHCNSLSV